MACYKDSTITVNGVEYVILGTELGTGMYTIEFV